MTSELEDTTTAPVRFPFEGLTGLDLPQEYGTLLRDGRPIRIQLPHGEPAWLVTRHEDARVVLADPRFSRNEATRRDEPRMTEAAVPESILTMDDPEHGRVRKIVASAFTVRRVQKMRPWIADLADRTVKGLVEQEAPADFVETVALPIPITVICELLGVPEEDWPRVRVWGDGILSTSGLGDEDMMSNFFALFTYVQELVKLRRQNPGDDLTSALISARDDDDKLSDDELTSLCIATLIGGFETTASALPNAVYVLLQRPERWQELCDDPSRIPAVTQELLRFLPFNANGVSPRYAREDVDLGDFTVRAGDPVVVDITAANHDGAVFENPDELDPARGAKQHMSFGHGPHRCLGANLATVEIEEGLRALVTQAPGLRIVDVQWKDNHTTRGARSLRVAW